MAGAFCADRQFYRNQQLVGGQRRLEDAAEEVSRGDSPLAMLSAGYDCRIEREHTGRQFGCRIRVSEASTERSPVADRRMRDLSHSLREKRRVGCDFG